MIYQIFANLILFILASIGILRNRENIITILICIEMILLSVNLNFAFFSIYLNDRYGEIFSLFILTVAAAESAVGLSILIMYFRLRGTISLNKLALLKY